MAKWIYKKHNAKELKEYTEVKIVNLKTLPGGGYSVSSMRSKSYEIVDGQYSPRGRFSQGGTSISSVDSHFWWNSSTTPYGLDSTPKQLSENDRYASRIVVVSSTKRYDGWYTYTIDMYQIVPKHLGWEMGSFISEVIAEEGTYPNNDRHTDGYWYVKDRLANTAPQISGSDLNLGSKTSDFNVDYIVTDTTENDTVKVQIYINDILKETNNTVSLGYKYIFTVKLDELSLGNHTVKIVATDSHNVTDERVYSFTKSNTAPVITSKQGTDLGEKNTAFSYVYQVYDANKDKVNVTISLNGVEFSNLSAVPQNEDLDFTIEDEVIYGLELGKINNITIKADDTKGGITYHRITFIRTNSPPIISGNDRDLGTKTVAFSTTISATDVEKDEIQLLVYIDDKEFKDLGVVVDNKTYTIQIDHDTFIELSPGKHTIKIVATDSKGASSERLLTFTRKVDELEVIFEINEMDIASTKVLFDALFKTITNREDNLKIFATNNYYDSNPVWEDITGPSLKRLAYVFTNKTSTANKWGLAIKVTYKGQGIAIMTGMTGGYE